MTLKSFSLLAPICVFGAALAAAGAEPAFPASGAPYPVVYRWGAANKHGGALANEAYARWLNRPAVWVEDFPPIETWDHLEGQGWQLGEWSKWKQVSPGRRFIFSVPLLPEPWDRSGPKFISDPANRVYFHCYFDVQAGDGHHQLSPGLSDAETNEFPRSAAKFKELFGQAK